MENDGDKSLTIFDTPRDVKGTAFLSFTHALEAGRPVVLPAGAEAGQAYQFAQQVRALHGW